MRIKINVTKEILEKSMYCGFTKRQNDFETHCAVALAVREIFPNALVEPQRLKPFGRGGGVDIFLPEVAYDFISDFDFAGSPVDRTKMKPISFEIDIPDSIIESIGLQELETILSKSVNLELVDRH